MARTSYHTGDSGLWTSHMFGVFRDRIGALSGPESARTDRGLADWIGVDR